MGGSIAITIIKNGERIHMTRHTNIMPYNLHHPDFLNGGKTYDDFIEHFEQIKDNPEFIYSNPWDFSPEGYGIVIIDFDRRKIYSSQGYCAIGSKLINMKGYHAKLTKDGTAAIEYHLPKTSSIMLSWPQKGFTITVEPSEDDAELFFTLLRTESVNRVESFTAEPSEIIRQGRAGYHTFIKKVIKTIFNKKWRGFFVVYPYMQGFEILDYTGDIAGLFNVIKTEYELSDEEKSGWTEYIRNRNY